MHVYIAPVHARGCMHPRSCRIKEGWKRSRVAVYFFANLDAPLTLSKFRRILSNSAFAPLRKQCLHAQDRLAEVRLKPCLPSCLCNCPANTSRTTPIPAIVFIHPSTLSPASTGASRKVVHTALCNYALRLTLLSMYRRNESCTR
jgi:hypothetical protein